MIPKLFPSTETAFTSEGLGRLTEARKCEVTEERNGSYELVMEYPVNGSLFASIVPGCYILATHDDSGDLQAFQIYSTSAPLDGWMTINAWHISYALNNIIVTPFTATTCATALAGISANSVNTNPFTFTTDKTLTANFAPDVPTSARGLLGGMRGSILDVYGPGEFEFDMFDVKFLASRGTSTNAVIRYGKNLKKLDYELDASNVFNAVVPYWTNETTVVYVGHPIVKTGQTVGRTIALDLSGEFDEEPTVADLETRAQAYIDASHNYLVKDNIKVDFVPLWQTTEYKNYASLERARLCDTVTVYYEKFGINATAKIIKTVFNTILDRYILMELGEPTTSLSQQIQADVSGEITGEIPQAVRRVLSGDITVGTIVSNTHTIKPTTSTGAAGIAIDTYDDLQNGLLLMTTYTAHGRTSLYRFAFSEYSLSSITNEPLAYREIYRLPSPDFDRVSNETYGIWTTKTMPEAPTTTGVYVPKADVSNGVATYSWEEKGGGGGGATDYETLSNLPKIENVLLTGNKTFADLGLSAITNAEIDAIMA